MEQGDKQTNKRTDRKSDQIRKSSRVVDMSWAADYLDDTWENEHAAKGAYDTQVIPPLKKYLPADAAGADPLSSTQEFKAVPGETAANAGRTAGQRAAAKDSSESDDDLPIVDAQTGREFTSGEVVQEDEDDLKIRDAVTDQTVASMEEAKAVRRAAAFFDLREDMDERPLIRDAISGSSFGAQSGTSASDGMAKVRQALASAPKMPAFMNRKSDMASAQTSESLTSNSSSRSGTFTSDIHRDASRPSAASAGQAVRPAPVQDTLKAEETQAKTIVASKEVMNVRKAASGAAASRIDLEELFQDDDIDLEPDEDDLYDQYEDITDYDDYDDFDHYDDVDELDDEPARYYEPEDEYDDRYVKSRRRSDKYYYGYKEPRSPLRFIPLVLVVAICVLGFIVAMQICHDVPLNASDYSKVKYTVEAGLTDEQLSEDLQALGIIDNPLVFRLRCKFYSADYVPGTYELSPCYSTEKIINILSGYIYGADD